MNKLLTISFLITVLITSCVKNNRHQKVIGKLSFSHTNYDTIYFVQGWSLDSTYYKKYSLQAAIKDDVFYLKNELPYPHLFYIKFKQEIDSIPFRGGKYFIDASTDSTNINSNGECSFVNGKTHQEFKNKFIPFFYKNNDYSCSSNSFAWYRFLNGKEFKNKLLNYTKTNPNSYVALWHLAEEISNGHLEVYEEILASFSPQIKEKKLWKELSKKMKKIRIKENKPFPKLLLKNSSLEEVKLEIPKEKYTLVYYWFSRCRPCLESFPGLKKIYNEYHQKGFEIISISVDQTENIEIWKERIVKYDLNWTHYLDENRIQAKIDRVNGFPTTYLLDKNGNIIRKNIPLNELDIFLKENFMN